MIIKGKSRAEPGALAKHLGNAEKNERVSVIETRGTVADDLDGALREMSAHAAGTRCERPLYHAAISPGLPHILTPEQREEAISALEDRLGLTGHARVVVLHEKLGRQHIHVVWSRIDLDHMRTVADSHNYRKHEEVARDLERRFGHERVQGAHHERDGVDRPDRTPSRAELRQEERTGIKGKQVKAEVSALFRSSDNADAFRAALEDAGYVLAQGDRRDFIIVDRKGGTHSLGRRIDGINAAGLREFMSPIDKSQLPDSDRAKEIALQRKHTADEMLKAKQYGSGGDYVSQSQAAQKDHQRRQARLDAEAEKIRTFDYGKPREESVRREQADREERERQRREAEDDTKKKSREGKTKKQKSAADGEITDRKARLVDRVSEDEWGRTVIDEGPDRQRGASGRGRTRSRD